MYNNSNGNSSLEDAAVLSALMEERTDFNQKESKLLDQICESLYKLDDSTAKLEEAGNGVTAFFHRQQAIGEMRKIIKDSEKLEEIDERANAQAFQADENDRERMENISEKIDGVFEKLEETLIALEQSDDTNHTEGFREQQKALLMVKQILREAGKYNAFNDDEAAQIHQLNSNL